MAAERPLDDGSGRASVSLPELVGLRARVARLRLPPRDSRAAPAGQQASRLFGRGMDYAESRVYQAGDDVRRMDWRLTARSGKLHTKLFQEEREGRLLVLLDTHPSMRFGTRVRFKSVQAARAAAVAAWYAARAGERVGALAFGPGRQLLRPRQGSHGALALCGALAAWDQSVADIADPAEAEPLSAAISRASRLIRGASRVLVISDGGSCDAAAVDRLRHLARQAQVGVLVVADPLELGMPPAGRYPLEHDGQRREVDLHAARQRLQFQQALGAGVSRLGVAAQEAGLRWRTLDTRADPLDAVLAVLGTRGRR